MNRIVLGILGFVILVGTLLWFRWSGEADNLVAASKRTTSNEQSSGGATFAAPAQVYPQSEPTAPNYPATDGSAGSPSYIYDPQGRLMLIHYPDGSVYTYSYDSRGNKIREVTRKGEVWSYIYDASGKPLAVTDPQGRKKFLSAAPASR